VPASGVIARLLVGGGPGRLIGRAVLAAGMLYLLYTLVVGVQELGRLDWGRYLQATLAGFALYPLSLLCQALAWALALGLARRNRLHADWRDVRIYASSHLVRRLPGGFWHVASRVGAYREQGLPSRVPIAASVGELLLLLGAAAAVYLVITFFPIQAEALEVLAIVAAGGLVGWAVAYLLTSLPWLGGAGLASARTPRSRTALVYAAVAELYVIALVVGGAILWPFLSAGSADGFTLLQAIAIWALVGGVGAVAALVPGGFGVRDLTLFVVLAAYLAPPAPTIVTLLFRLLFVASDLLWGSALFLVARRLSPGQPA